MRRTQEDYEDEFDDFDCMSCPLWELSGYTYCICLEQAEQEYQQKKQKRNNMRDELP